ncbi:Mucin-associated surface protein (MASP), subgroup S040 [Trypanosoma cruzi]|nr:Mucin-associated surface protein (MASP), subgroup S040 [Trypanosoma cruzi]
MAMMMTGRVLLVVCVLCVLWCGAGGVYARDIDNKALGDCMTSGVLGTNCSRVPGGCDKTAPKLPFRSALPITVLQADAPEGEVPASEGGNSSESSGTGGSGGRSGGVDGMKSGQSGVSGGDNLSNPSSSSGGSSPRPPTLDGKGAPQDPGEDPSPQGRKSPEKVVQSGTSVDSALLKREEVQKSEPDTQKIRAEALVTFGGTGNEARREAEDTDNTPSGPPVKTVTPQAEVLSPPAGGVPPASDDTHNSPENNAGNSASKNETKSNPLERPSEDGEAGQQDKEADTQGAQETEGTQGTAASPISTSGSGGAQSEADADDDDPQRPNPEGPQNDGTEAGDTHGPSAASDAAPQAAKAIAAQTNGTVTPGDSDGSTAVSHSTSPLLLLVVACAAAAAVVAA